MPTYTVRQQQVLEFVRATLAQEVDLRAAGTEIVSLEEEPQSSIDYRNHMNSAGSPSETVAASYSWRPSFDEFSPMNRFERAATAPGTCLRKRQGAIEVSPRRR